MSISTIDKLHILSLTEAGAHEVKREFFKRFSDEHMTVEDVAARYSQELRVRWERIAPEIKYAQFFQLTLTTNGNLRVSEHIKNIMVTLIADFPDYGFIHENAWTDNDDNAHMFGTEHQWGISKNSNGIEWHQKFVIKDTSEKSILDVLKERAMAERNDGGES